MRRGNSLTSPSKYLTEEAPVKNLKFLTEFMRQMGLGIEDVAEAAGVLTNSARRWFLTDNMSLSKVMKVAEHFGYDIIIEYEIKETVINRTKIIIEEPRRISDVDTTKRLSFIRVAMSRAGITTTQLAEKLGCIRGAVQKFFQTDDTSVANIYKIAEAFDWTVKITFKKKSA